MGLGAKIRAIREARKWKQGYLAERAGVSQPTLSIIEKRDSNRSVYLVPLARALGLTVEELRAHTVEELLAADMSFGKAAGQPASVTQEPDPLTLYGTPGARQSQLLRLFDELTPAQQLAYLQELETTVQANRAIALHYKDRPMRSVENARVESTFGLPRK